MPQPIQRKRNIMEFAQFYGQKWEDTRLRNRKRFTVKPGSQGYQTYYPPSGAASTSYGVRSYSGLRQETSDFDNSSRLKKLGKEDVGGPFYSLKIEITPPSFGDGDELSYRYLNGTQKIVGPIYPSSNAYNLAFQAWNTKNIAVSSNLPRVTDSEMLSFGATGISRCLPNVPDSPLITTIAETATGGLPSIVGRKLLKERSISSVGDEYLNYQFGVAPLISDVQSLIKSTSQFDKIIKQMKHDSGRLIRRQVELVNESKVLEDTTVNGAYTYPSWVYGKYNLKRSTTRRVWFSGAFKHSYPTQLDDWTTKLREFDRVYGLIPNADTVWNLIPYSWLVDYQGNIGDVMKNVSYLGKDGLELAYGYVMAETTYTYTESFEGTNDPNGYYSNPPLKTSTSIKYSIKQRQRATPFGFGVSLSALTAQQSAILTALGLSRLKL